MGQLSNQPRAKLRFKKEAKSRSGGGYRRIMVDSGQSLSHYTILRPLGKGGMGEVFLAEDTVLGRKVALKFLAKDAISDPVARGRFLREAKSAAAIDSDSDSGTDAAYGLGVALRLGKVALRAEGEQFKIADADDVYMFSVGATFTF